MLLILSGITITYVLGEDGIIAQAKLAAEKTRIANYQTVLEMIRASLEPEKVLEELTTEEFLNRYEEMAKKEAENGALKDATVKGPQEGMKDKVRVQTKEGDIFEITEEGVEYKGTFKEGEIQETPDLKEADITWEVSETKQTKEKVTVKIILTNPNENFTLQYAKKDKNEEPTEEDWKEYKGEILTFTQNGNAFARLVNSLGDPGVHATKYVGNIDKLSPNEFEAHADATTNSITVKGHTEDQEENEMYSKSKITKYYFKDITGIEDETSIKSSEGWIEETAEETGDTSHTFSGLTQGKPYTFVMKAVDEAENETISSEVQKNTTTVPGLTGGDEGVKDADITFKADKTNWTNTDVTVTIKVNKKIEDGYYLKYAQKPLNQEPGENDWKDCVTGQQVQLSVNGNVYVRLIDSSKQDAGKDLYATKTVNNIDKTPPQASGTGIKVTETTVSSISLSLGVTDEGGSGIDRVEWYYKKKNDSTWENQTTTVPKVEGTNNGPSSYTATITIGGLEAATEYDIKATVYDVAGTPKDATQIPGKTDEILTSSITVSPKTAEVEVDETVKLTATILPANRTSKNVTWTSDHTGIAQVKVNADGTATVTGKGVGKANITVTAQDSTKKSATCTVTVKAKRNEIAKQYGIKQSTNKQVSDGSKGTNNNMWIPKGYTVLDPAKNSNVSYKDNNNPQIDEGIVISDGVDTTGKSTGNEFVWVPVQNPEEMYGTGRNIYLGKLYAFNNGVPERVNWYENSNGTMTWASDENYREPGVLVDIDSDLYVSIIDPSLNTVTFSRQLEKEFKAMIDSVKQYKGFYIGRYETGNLEASDTTPVVKSGNQKNANVNWYWQYKNSKKLAQRFRSNK